MQMKKVLSIILAVVMLISVIPFSAFATEWTDYYVMASYIQKGDVLTSGVKRIMDLDGYTLTLQAGGYGEEYPEEAKASDLVTTEFDYMSRPTPMSEDALPMIYVMDDNYGRYYPYDANGITNKWCVVDVDHDNRTITLSGRSTPIANYTITWKNDDGSTIDTTEVQEGQVPSHANPTKDNYVFAGWTPLPAAATADATYTATFAPAGGETVRLSQLTAGAEYAPGTIIAQDGGQMWAFSVYVDNAYRGNFLDSWAAEYGAPAFITADYIRFVSSSDSSYYFETFTPAPAANNSVNLTLGEDITSNYYVDYTKYEGAAKIVYTYNGVNEREAKEEVSQTVDLTDIPAAMLSGDKLMLTVSQAPAQMAEPVEIEILGANDQVIDTLDFSAKAYCDKVLGMTVEQLAALPDVGTTEKATQFQTLCHTLIAYGQAAQGVFADYMNEYQPPEVTCENEEVNAQIEAATPEANYSLDNSGMIKFSSVSFVCTKDARLRFYLDTSAATYTPAAPTAVMGDTACNAALKYTMDGSVKKYFVEVSDIKAAYFGDKITVNYGGSTITFSVLDFAGIVLASSDSDAMQHFAKTLVVYNTNALAFFSN